MELPVLVLLVPVMSTTKLAKPAFAKMGLNAPKLVKFKVPEYPLVPQLKDAETSAAVYSEI